MLGDKKLFPGVTGEELAEQERVEHQRMLAEAEAVRRANEQARIQAEQKRKDDERKVAYGTYIDYKWEHQRREHRSLKDIIQGLGMFMGIWLVANLFGAGAEEERDPFGRDESKLTTEQRLRDAFWPISNGWYVKHTDSYVMGGQVIEGEHIYTYDENAKGQFRPRGVWWVNMAFLLTGICIVIGELNKARKENKKIQSDNKSARMYNEIAKQAVDTMLELKEFGHKLNLNERDIETIVEKVPDVISRMSEAERIYFDMLMNGEIDIASNKSFCDMAVAVMEGHLKTHPEDFEQILQKFEPKSIPQSLMNKYGNNNGRR